ncbi:MAG TPA: hypothetical protein VFZ86_02225, partial [Thermoleophilia bacterium]|nr:hypothetical protein [Thermoleophilia bacterium]
GVLLVKAERHSRAEDAAELQAHRDSVWAEVSHLLDDMVEEPDAGAPEPDAAKPAPAAGLPAPAAGADRVPPPLL